MVFFASKSLVVNINQNPPKPRCKQDLDLRPFVPLEKLCQLNQLVHYAQIFDEFSSEIDNQLCFLEAFFNKHSSISMLLETDCHLFEWRRRS